MPLTAQVWSWAPTAAAEEDEEPPLISEEVPQLIQRLHRLLQTYDFSADSLETVVSTLARLAACPYLDLPAMDGLCNLLKSIARRSMSEVIFDNGSTVAVFNIVRLYSAPACRLGSAACLLVFNKLLEVYVTRNAACHQLRLSPSTLVHLLQAVAAMGGLTSSELAWSTWPAVVNNQAGILRSLLDVDDEDNQLVPKANSLARFMAHASQRVRVEAAQLWLSLSDDHHHHPSTAGGRTLPRVFEDLWQRDVNTSWTDEDIELRTRYHTAYSIPVYLKNKQFVGPVYFRSASDPVPLEKITFRIFFILFKNKSQKKPQIQVILIAQNLLKGQCHEIFAPFFIILTLLGKLFIC